MSVASALESELAPYIKDFEGWTGEIGIIALHILWELKQQARSKFAPMISLFPETIPLPLFWSDEELDVAQKSSTKGIKGFVQDVEEDLTISKLVALDQVHLELFQRKYLTSTNSSGLLGLSFPDHFLLTMNYGLSQFLTM